MTAPGLVLQLFADKHKCIMEQTEKTKGKAVFCMHGEPKWWSLMREEEEVF